MADKRINQFEVWVVSLDPTTGKEIQKTRPCLIISPNELNDFLYTVIVVPLTSTRKNYPFRVNCHFHDTNGQLALDHIRSVDKSRLIKCVGKIEDTVALEVSSTLTQIFEFK